MARMCGIRSRKLNEKDDPLSNDCKEDLLRFREILALVSLILLLGCSAAPQNVVPTRESIAKEMCNALPKGILLADAAAFMSVSYGTILMGGDGRRAFLALKEPTRCACLVGFSEGGLTTDASVRCAS
jgi:hypothetical protein